MQALARRRGQLWIAGTLGLLVVGVLAWASAPTAAEESAQAAEESARAAVTEAGRSAGAGSGLPAEAGSTHRAIPVVVEREGCVAQPDRRPSRTGERFRDELGVVSRDGSLLLEHGLTHECCHSVDVEVSASGGAVRFLEVWDGDGCRCWCSSRISARTSRLPPGEYAVEVVTARRGGPPEKRLQIFAETIAIE